MFFVIICDHLFLYYVKNTFIITSSINKWASWLKTTKREILGYKKFKI